MRSILIFLFLFCYTPLLAQPDPEIWLGDLKISEEGLEVQYLTNISGNPGYDNQPAFFPDGKGLLYASERNESPDVRAFSIVLNEHRWLTQLPGGEYSPTVMPDKEHFSAIRLKPDGEQLLWKFPLSGTGEPEVIIPDEVIGYHAWLNDHLLYAFVLGEPATLVEFDLEAGTRKKIATNPGRSLHKIPGTNAISYVDKNDAGNWLIKSYDPGTKQVATLVSALPGSDDMAWTPESYILMGAGNTLSYWKPGGTWSEPVQIFSEKGTISRLAISPEGNKIAIVFTKD